MKYTLCTGRYRTPKSWEDIWQANRCDVVPYGYACIEVGQCTRNEPNTLALCGNLGHVGELLNGSKPYELCGWSAAVLALAMIAYCNETDMLYKEQDCLAFGPWVEQMYADLGDRGMVFGRAMKHAPYMPCAQSLFLIRHKFIPEFVTKYIQLGSDASVDNLPEHKFAKLEAATPQHYARLSFGYDRERPIQYEDRVFYAQKLTAEELAELRRRNLI